MKIIEDYKNSSLSEEDYLDLRRLIRSFWLTYLYFSFYSNKKTNSNLYYLLFFHVNSKLISDALSMIKQNKSNLN
jgi:hypothetical protein